MHIAYNSCGNRHCPKCQGAAAREWRVSLRPRAQEERRLDLQDPERVSRTHLWIVWVPPLVSLLLGLLTAWRRRR